MAIASVGSLGTFSNFGNGNTLSGSPSAQLDAGNLGVLVVVVDNSGTTDADFSDVTSVTDSVGNSYTKIGEITNGEGAASAGVVCSLWMTRATTSLTTGGTLTINFKTANAGERCASFWEFTVGGHIGVAGKNTNVTDASTDFGSLSVSGLGSRSYLFFRGLGKEANSTTALTVTANYTAITAARSRNNSGAVLVRGEFRIVTATSETSNPTLAVSGDTASVMCALMESLEQSPSDNVNNLSDTLAKAVGIPKTFADDANNLADAHTKQLVHLKTFTDDANNLSDYFTYAKRPRWLDSYAQVKADVGGALSLSLSDSINNLADSLTMQEGELLTFSESVNNLSDTLALGYGLLHSDDLNLLADAVTKQVGVPLLFTDTLATLSDAQVITLGYEEPCADSLTIATDALNLGHGLAAADTLVLSDAVALRLEQRLDFSDALTFTDAEDHQLGTQVALTDALPTLTDSTLLGYGLVITEPLSPPLSDTAAIQLEHREQFADSLTLTDSESHLLDYELTFSDTVDLLADSVTLRLDHLFAAADTLPTYIDYATACLYVLGIEVECVDSDAHIGLEFYDSLTLTDAFAKQLISNVAELTVEVDDALVLDDSLQLGHGLIFDDAVTLADSLTATLTHLVTFTDALSLTDTTTLVMGQMAGLDDSFILTDSQSSVMGYNEPLSDSVNLLADSAVIIGGELVEASDALTLTDALSLLLAHLLTATDALPLNDSATLLLVHLLQFNDAVTLADSISTDAPQGPNIQLGITDALNLSDTIALTIGYQLTLADNGANWADSLAETLGYSVILADNAATLTDAITFSGTSLLRLTDSFTLTDALAKFGEGYLTIADSFDLADSFAIDLRGPDFNLDLADSLILTDAFTFTLGNELQLTLTFSDVLTLADHYFDIRHPYASSGKRHVVVSSAPRTIVVDKERVVQVPARERIKQVE